MKDSGKIEALTENLKGFVNLSFELNKLEAVERSSTVGAGLISGLLVGFVLIFFLFFVSMGIGFYLSEKLGNTYVGFAITSGFYLILGICLFLTRKKLIENPLRDKMIQKVFNAEKI